MTPDYSRSDAERRMRLLEMAGGDLERAMKLEQWVTVGSTFGIGPSVTAKTTDQWIMSEAEVALRFAEPDGLDLPPSLDRRKTKSDAS